MPPTLAATAKNFNGQRLLSQQQQNTARVRSFIRLLLIRSYIRSFVHSFDCSFARSIDKERGRARRAYVSTGERREGHEEGNIAQGVRVRGAGKPFEHVPSTAKNG